MANRAERRRTMKTTELREQAIEALDQTPYIDIETPDAAVYRVWHPLLVDDDAQTRIDRLNAHEDMDKDELDQIVVPYRVKGKLADPYNIRSARAILGPEIHKEFIKSGGQSNDIQLAWNEMVRQHEELTEGLEDPKADTP